MLEEACEGSRSKKVRCKRDAVRAASRGCCCGEEPKPHRWNAFGDRTARRLKQATRARSHGEIGRDPTKDGARHCGASQRRDAARSRRRRAREVRATVVLSQPKGAQGEQRTTSTKRAGGIPARGNRRWAAPKRGGRSGAGGISRASREMAKVTRERSPSLPSQSGANRQLGRETKRHQRCARAPRLAPNGVPSSAEQRTTERRRYGRARDVQRSHADAEARSEPETRLAARE
jgi:hypothetical protein